jgi:hypothetical protein
MRREPIRIADIVTLTTFHRNEEFLLFVRIQFISEFINFVRLLFDLQFKIEKLLDEFRYQFLAVLIVRPAPRRVVISHIIFAVVVVSL